MISEHGAASPEADMRDPKTLRVVLGCSLCLIFTARPAARADSALSSSLSSSLADELSSQTEAEVGIWHRPAGPMSDPLERGAPPGGSYGTNKPVPQTPTSSEPSSTTWGPTIRVGTVVGTVDAAAVSATGLGLTLGAGHRFGRLALESELTAMRLLEKGPSSLHLGQSARLGVIVRYDVVRTSSRVAGPNTKLALFLEGGASQSWTQWFEPEVDERQRIVPRDTRRIEGQAGFGLTIDHRYVTSGGNSGHFSWHLGWRFAAPSPEEPGYACRGACRLAEEPMQTDNFEGSVLFQSSLGFSW